MPFKTKQQKILASKHRIATFDGGYAKYVSKTKENTNLVESKSETSKPRDFFEKKNTYVRHEVLKISLLALLIIGLQIFLKIGSAAF